MDGNTGFWADIGAEIRKHRRGAMDLTQAEFGAWLGGLTKDQVSKMERGFSRFPLQHCYLLERSMKRKDIADFYYSKAEREQ